MTIDLAGTAKGVTVIVESHRPGDGAESSWFADSLFSMLIDYYPEVVGRPYGSGATRENTLPLLRDVSPGFFIVYAKGHSGRTTFPSALRTEHVMLAKNMPVFYREIADEIGSKLFYYYSGLMDGVAGIRHPDWRMLDHEGQPICFFDDWMDWFLGYPICPLSDYFEQWVTVHMAELFATARPDGIWVDGDWTGPCYCPRCVGRFRTKTGFDGPMPKPRDLSTPEGVAWAAEWSAIVDEWWGKVSALIKSHDPNCLYSSGNGTARAEYAHRFDWRSGDFATPYNHRLRQSVMMRRYTTQSLPYDSMTADTGYLPSRPNSRTRPKTLDRMLQEGAGILANGGQWCYWTYPMPNGALVPSKMRKAATAAEFARARQETVLHTRSFSWTAILDADPTSSPPGTAALPGDNIFGAAKALIALHRSPDIIDESELRAEMPYDLIVVADQRSLSAATVGLLEQFVRRGGKLLSTGSSAESPELQRLLGIERVQQKALNEGNIFLKNGDPLLLETSWDRIEPVEAAAIAPLYRCWDDDNIEVRNLPICYPINAMVDEEAPEPAGFPAATIRRVGDGLAIHIATDLFSTYWRNGHPDLLAWVRELLDQLQPEPLFRTDARSFVEVALRRKGESLLVHLVNGNPGRDLSWVDTEDLWVDDIPEVGPITCWIRCADAPSRVRALPEGEVVWGWCDGILVVTLERLEIHTCLAIDDWRSPH